VNPLPAVAFNQNNPRICLGDTLTISVTGGATYTWDTHTSLQPSGNGSTLVWPAIDTWFALNARSDAGCNNRDSLKVTVVQPFSLVAKENYEACLGETVSLSATGANRYQWIPAAGLSNAAIANPVANINSSAQYRVVGSDAFGCFADTVNVQVTIHALPQVNAGPDVSVLSGESVQLNASSTLQNVNWNWTPATYLNCTNCPNPVSKPGNDITYTATATTVHGCSASDEVSIVLLCAEDRIYIPTGFTPNGNGLNERFGILGSGFSLIKSFRIFDRWGQLAFERSGTLPADPQSFWNGTYPGGKQAPSGTYQYVAEVACATGAVFSFKGSVTLIR
jgi:gliding motility-associated-like protein